MHIWSIDVQRVDREINHYDAVVPLVVRIMQLRPWRCHVKFKAILHSSSRDLTRPSQQRDSASRPPRRGEATGLKSVCETHSDPTEVDMNYCGVDLHSNNCVSIARKLRREPRATAGYCLC